MNISNYWIPKDVECPQCHITFTQSNQTHIYCTPECRSKYAKSKKPKRYCHICGNELSYGQGKYCSDDCVLASRRVKKKPCVICGGKLGPNRSKYCSERCSYLSGLAKKKDSYIPVDDETKKINRQRRTEKYRLNKAIIEKQRKEELIEQARLDEIERLNRSKQKYADMYIDGLIERYKGTDRLLRIESMEEFNDISDDIKSKYEVYKDQL